MKLQQIEQKSIRVLASRNGRNAAVYYRMQAPLSVCAYRWGIEAELKRPDVGDAETFDVLWLQQPTSSHELIVARQFKEAGGTVIVDCDDFLPALPPSWPCYSNYFNNAEARRTLLYHKMTVDVADCLTVPTDEMAQAVAESDFYGIDGSKVHVLPNCVLAGDWDTLLPTGHNVQGQVVGWFGTDNHWDDLQEIVLAIDEALEETGASLAILGYPDVVGSFPDRMKERTYVHLPVDINRDFKNMRRMIMAFDLGVAWCTDRLTTNRLRSPLKALQYGAAGVPVVASRAVYGTLSDFSGLVVDSPADLTEKIVWALGEGKAQMRERANRWHGEVMKRHTYETQAHRWLDLVNELMG